MTFSILTFFLVGPYIFSQAIEVECIVDGRVGAYLVLKPAYYDEASLPKVGEQATLYIYVDEGLPEGKEAGYYDLFPIVVIKLITEDKKLRIKCLGDVESARIKHGLQNVLLTSDKKVKLIWGSTD